MERLTINKGTAEMNMVELARNCCYAENRMARYRDFERDVDARDFARELMVKHGFWKEGEDVELTDDEIFDETMIDLLQYAEDDVEILIALFYRNLWAMADLRETLKEYEDLEEQGKLKKFPCSVGDTVYTSHSMQGWYFRKENRPYVAKVVFIGFNGTDNYINVDFGNGHMLQFKFSDIGKTVFFTRPAAEQALKEMEGRDE